MKARVKATGKIVEINESSTIYDAGMRHIYNASELENIPDSNPDYWTRLEHQAAIAAMQGMLIHYGALDECGDLSILTSSCVNLAHALVEKYKEKEEK